jgi:hypothetical protein
LRSPGRPARLSRTSTAPVIPGGVVFVQTDNTAGNQVVAYDRSVGGTLRQAGSYPTGGLGGQTGGSGADHLSSQGSLGYDRQQALALADLLGLRGHAPQQSIS